MGRGAGVSPGWGGCAPLFHAGIRAFVRWLLLGAGNFSGRNSSRHIGCVPGGCGIKGARLCCPGGLTATAGDTAPRRVEQGLDQHRDTWSPRSALPEHRRCPQVHPVSLGRCHLQHGIPGKGIPALWGVYISTSGTRRKRKAIPIVQFAAAFE